MWIRPQPFGLAPASFSLRRRQRHPTPVLLPGKSHGRRSLVGCSPWGRWEAGRTERLHFHFSLSCIGEGNGNPLQCSCLENPRDGGAWGAAVYGVAQSRTRLKWLSSSSSFLLTESMDMSLSKLQETVKFRNVWQFREVPQFMGSQTVRHDLVTERVSSLRQLWSCLEVEVEKFFLPEARKEQSPCCGLRWKCGEKKTVGSLLNISV